MISVLLFACSDPTEYAQVDSGNILVRCGTLIDGRSDNVLKNMSVLIENGHFSRIYPQTEAQAGVEVLDLSEYTCLPGQIATCVMKSIVVKRWGSAYRNQAIT